jgi:predicted 3-demethylubiquinone-9 3-methyltransferase (glyoxalase superfamily)
LQKITTFLTFAERGEEAVNFYVATFPNSRITNLVRSEEGGPLPAGTLLNASFELDGQAFMAMDGGPHFSFAQGTSLFVHCTTQEEVDDYWNKLSAGGEEQPCGWVKDKYGLSWQIVPEQLGQLMQDPDRERAGRVMQAMLQMKKIDIAALEQA